MKKVILFVLFALCLPIEVVAQEMIHTARVKPIYFGSNGAVFYYGPVLQGDLTFNWDSGCFFTLWASTAANVHKDFDKEVDFIVGCGGSLGRMNYVVDLGYFVIDPIIDVVNTNFKLSFGPASVQPFVRAEFYSPAEKGGPKKGLITRFGLGHNIELGSKWTFNSKEELIHDSGALGFDNGWLAQGYVGSTFSPGWNEGRTNLTVGIKWSAPLTVDDSRKNKVVWEVGFTHQFK